MKKHSLSQEAGGAVIVVLLVLVIAVGLVGTAVYLSSSQNRVAVRQREVMESVAVADGALDYVYAVWRDMIRDGGTKAPSNKKLNQDKRIKDMKANKSTESPALELAATGNQLSNFTMGATDPWGGNPADDDDNTVPIRYDVAVDEFPGWKGKACYYKTTITATGPKTLAGSKNPAATVSRYFSMTSVPLFQAAIFYMNDLEIHPGALMTIKGLVHTNANLYASGYAKLQFLDNVSYAKTFTEGAPAIGDWTGYDMDISPTVTPYWSDDLQTGSSTARDKQVTQVDRIEPFGKSAQTLFNTTDSNKNNDGYHEWIEPPVSGASNPDPTEISDQRLYNKAGVRIQIDSSKTVSDPNRLIITGANGTTLAAADITRVKAAIDAGTTIYDWREGGGVSGSASGNIKVTSVDMKLLNTALTPLSNFNGVVYVNDVATTKDAIRLKNGANLAMDLTIASENPVYIQGDYNTGPATESGAHNPNTIPSNNGGNTNGTEDPFAPGYVKKSAAVIADAVIILSNSWNDANASSTIGSRVATPTTVNTAIMAGDVPTNYNNNDTASGGAHNFPRFLEAWGDPYHNTYIDFTYYGSMVEAFNSKTFTGAWSTGNVYVWPNRKWNFESLFTANPPPGTVAGTTFSRGRWERL